MDKLGLALLALLAFPFSSAFGHAQNSPLAQSHGACELTTEDYAVYSAVFDNLGKPEDPEEEWRNKSDLIVSDRTVNNQTGGDGIWGFRSNSKQAPLPQTVTNYRSRAMSICVVRPLFGAKLSPHLISAEEISKFFKHGDGWRKFYESYPKSSGYWDISPVGYSDDGLEALVYLGHHCGYLCGTGHLVLLKKEDDAWVVKNRTMLWIS